MPTMHHLFSFVKKYGNKHRALYSLSMLVLFWAIFDGILSFLAPLIITQNGLSKTLMGIIIGSSSVAGAFFDFILCRLIKRSSHRRIMIAVFAICAVYPLILFEAKSMPLYLLAMALWGLYYDLHNISNFEFVGHHIEKEEHSASFGVIQVFQSLGYLLAPIIVGFAIGEIVDWKPFALAWIFLGISFLFFLVLIRINKSNETDERFGKYCRPVNFFAELNIWRSVGKIILPVLILTGLLNLTDSFFWTIGPILAENFPEKYRHFAGFFLAAYSLPPLLVGWTVGSVTAKYGKKKTAFSSYLLGSFILMSLFFTSNPVLLIFIIFAASFFIAFSWPSINGAYADYISESLTLEREIEGLEDFFANIGYVVGPIIAGILADHVGDKQTFIVLGAFGVLVSLLLLKITPKSINIRPREIHQQANNG